MRETRAAALPQGVLHFQSKLGFCYEYTHMYLPLFEKISENPQIMDKNSDVVNSAT
jgi:hypothetical protein